MSLTVEKKQQLHISVRNLVEFIFKAGDIDQRSGKIPNADAMLEGTRIHKKIQKSMGDGYQTEVPLKMILHQDLYDLEIEGRADGIFTEDDESVWIDEIKGIYRKLELVEEAVYVHKAQAMCYAYIFAWQNELNEIGVQVTYCNLDSEEIKRFREHFLFEDLKAWFESLLEKYYKWADFQCKWYQKRQQSIKQLQFPFEYRDGQKKLVQDVYRTILRQKNLFLQAPTGVGKTISTIFPAVKAVGENLANQIFYLTAKTITASVARETFELLKKSGYEAKIIQLTAKEKMCLCDEMECNPVNCEYARGHFDRVNDAVYEMIHSCDFFTREVILEQAKKWCVCPFEFQLDLSLWADNIICDYNYVFDPKVYLKRFFQEGIKGDYIFLVDEAHNLVERSRAMYSASIYKEDFLLVKRIMKTYHPKIVKLLDRCNKILLELKRECETYVVYDSIGNLHFALLRLVSELDEFLQKPMEFAGRKEVVDFYFSVRTFINIAELVDEHYVIYSEIQDDGRFMLKLFCVDPSENLQKCMNRAKATIYFSATLLPINYYKRLLSTKEDNYAVYAQSSFSSEQCQILMAKDVSTKYTRRTENEYIKIAEYIYQMCISRKGNYMAFFPSYQFMEKVYEAFEQIEDGNTKILVQKSGMSEGEREEFLLAFQEERDETLLAFCIMGGIFGEGIDLKNEQLIGVAVVGTGLPQVNYEREILKNYYDDRGENGFDYSFRFPGMNKVLQAAGRVIRTTEDRGVILLLDERFLQVDYQSLYPREWTNRKICDKKELLDYLCTFWKTI